MLHRLREAPHRQVECKSFSRVQQRWCSPSWNYRPIPLTCVSCKILEHIICKHILDHLEKNKILITWNHGFRSGYSCETPLITTVHDLFRKSDIGSQIDMIILDFSKAFDTARTESCSIRWYCRELTATSILPVWLPYQQTDESRCWWRRIRIGHRWLRCAPRDGSWSITFLIPHQRPPRCCEVESACLLTTACYTVPSRTWKITFPYRGTFNS